MAKKINYYNINKWFDNVGKFFNFLTKIPLLRKPIRNLKTQYSNICPYDERTIENKVLASLGFALLTSFVSGTVIFIVSLIFNGAELTTIISPIFTFILCYQLMVNAFKNNIKNKVEDGLSDYFLSVLHQYQSTKSIVGSVIAGADGNSIEILHIAEHIESIITSENQSKLVSEYVSNPNRSIYLKIFLEQCVMLYENGDSVLDSTGNSVFCTNIETLRIDMMKARIADKERNAKLAGLSFAIWLPTLAMGFIKTWGISLAQEMISFYNRYGFMVEIITYSTALALNSLVTRVKHPEMQVINISKRYYTIQDSLGIFNNAKESRIVKKLHQLNNNTPASVFYTKIYADAFFWFFATLAITIITNIISNTPITAGQIWFCLSSSLLTLTTVFKILFAFKVYRKNKSKEVNSFQLIMLSEQNMKNAYLSDLLTKLESVAYYYKLAINKCANNLNYNREEALNELKQVAHSEKDSDFESLVDMLLAIDSIGIKKAFSELRTTRDLRSEERVILTSIKTENQKNLLEVACYLPSVLVIGAYMLAPFLIISLSGTGNVFESLNTMQNFM